MLLWIDFIFHIYLLHVDSEEFFLYFMILTVIELWIGNDLLYMYSIILVNLNGSFNSYIYLCFRICYTKSDS